MFPGVAIPFGQVKLGIDTSVLNLDQGGISSANSGYTPRGNATGFSLLHTSGTGGQPKYGVVSQMPLLGSLEEQKINVADNRTYLTNRTNEVARVGYFRTTFETSKITTELTASHHAGILHYTFPPSENNTAHVLVDLAHVLPSGGGGYISQRYVKGELTVDPQGGGYSGSAWYNLGWNQGEAWQIFTTPTLSAYYDIYASDNLAIGALFSWEFESSQGLEIESRIGVSFINAQKAEILSSITVPAENGHANGTLLGLLYTHLYGTALMPTDRTNENPGGWDSKEPYYDDWYTMWDIFRCTTPFYHLVYTNRYVGMLRSIIDTWRFDGYLPDGRSGNQNGRTQGGSNADNVLADAYVKGLNKVKSINWKDAYKAVQKDAEVTPRRNIDFNAFDGGTKEGSPTEMRYLIGFPLGTLHKTSLAPSPKAWNMHKMISPLIFWQKRLDPKKTLKSTYKGPVWNENATVDLGDAGLGVHKGFFGSKSAQGVFDASLTYEGLIWEYSFNVPHDTAALIKLMDGPAGFERRLDASFIEGFSMGAGPANTAGTALFNPGNEPSFQTPFLYNYINGKQYKTVEKTRYIVNKYVQGVKINGKPINRSFIWHDEIINGGVLEFTMGPEAVGWDSGELPPSLSTGWK
ncbi:hypothetical protein RhiTH_000940 [Rhizoctonia solani]